MAEDEPTEFGALLRRQRHAAGLSREALAERAGLSAQAIGALERGERRAPYPDTVRRLALALDLSAEHRQTLEHAVSQHRRPPASVLRAPMPSPAPTVGLAPVPLTPLIGRAAELAGLAELLLQQEVRLVTLTGPAGVGKTRLALALAAQLADAFPQGVTVVQLAAVHAPTQVLPALAMRLGLQETGGEPLDRLCAAVQDAVVLLVLDNFEQVLPAAAALPMLLQRCPGVTLLVTSRTPLQLRAEQVFQVPPLALPDPQHLPPLDELAQVPAVALFVERATAVDQTFSLTEENAAAVAALSVHLDGLPLAIQLAAARTPLLSPQMILDRLGQRLALLQWRALDLPERQQTLSAAIAWSYDLLSEAEQALFRRLGVFVGGFTLEAAEALVAGTGVGDIDVVEILAALVAGSLVLSEEDAVDGRRFRLLESMRDYALDRLAERGERDAAHRAHAAYFVALAERAEPEMRGRGQRAWWLRLEQELENLRSALQWLADAGEGALELRLAAATGYFWSTRGYVAEGRRWVESALTRTPDADPHLRLKALNVFGELLAWQREGEQALAVLNEALALGLSLHAAGSVARSLAYLGIRAIILGAWDEANRLLEAALAAWQEVGDAWGVAFTRFRLGEIVLSQGDPARAALLLEEAVAGLRLVGDLRFMAAALSWLAFASGEGGDTRRAVVCFQECLDVGNQLQDPRLLCNGAERIALLAGEKMGADLLARLLGAVAGLRRARGLLGSLLRSRAEQLEATLLARLGPDRFEVANAAGRALSFDQTMALARQVLDGLADTLPVRLEPAGGAASDRATELLSPREHEVLRLIADGLSNKEIAARLVVAERTAKYHVTTVFNKLGAATRAQAVAVAAQRGLL